MAELVFLPLDAAGLRRLASAPILDVPAHAPTPGLYEALGYDAEMAEDAEFAALQYASVASLAHGVRLVVVAEAGYDVPADDSFGSVVVPRVAREQVVSLFIDDADAAALVSAARQAAAGRSLSEAWEQPAVQDLVTEADLLWHDAAEFDDVLERLE